VSATLAAWREEFEEEEAGERSAAPWLRPWQGLLALFSLGVVGFKLSEEHRPPDEAAAANRLHSPAL